MEENKTNKKNMKSNGEENRSEHKKSRATLTALLSALLVVFILLLTAVLFLAGLANNAILPDIGRLDGDLITDVFGSVAPLILSIFLVLLIAIIIILSNAHCARRIFMAYAVSFMTSGVLSLLAGIFIPKAIPYFSSGWQDMFLYRTVALKGFSQIFATILVLIGVIFLSVYFSIIAVKEGKKNEKVG